jgi:hypothetical protein
MVLPVPDARGHFLRVELEAVHFGNSALSTAKRLRLCCSSRAAPEFALHEELAPAGVDRDGEGKQKMTKFPRAHVVFLRSETSWVVVQAQNPSINSPTPRWYSGV